METVAKDLAARIATFETPHGAIGTPTIFPVVHPRDPIVPLDEIRRMGAECVITNAYMLWKNHRAQALEQGVHKLLGWDGSVMTDSGAFQLMQYGDVDVDNKAIIEFQKGIGVDIGVILDVPGIGSHKAVEENLATTVARAKELEPDGRIWCGPIQGGTYRDLRIASCKAMRKLGFPYYALGSVVPLMNDYRFAENIDIIAWCKQALPADAPIHHFGGGHPMFFAFATAMGADIFDSAAYSIFAKRGDYMTVSGTTPLVEMDYLPCSCPACQSRSPRDLDERALARHNLYATFEEINRIKQAIHEGTLWELLEERARGHPALYAAFRRMAKHTKYLESLDPYTKRRFFYLSKDSESRVELYRHKKTKCSSKGYVDAFPFKKVPCEVMQRYPFGQRELPVREAAPRCECTPLEKLNGLAEYQFGVPKLFPEGTRIELGTTGRMRRAYSGDKLLASIRAGDYVIIPHAIAHELHKRTKGWRVTVDQETAEFPAAGRTVYAKFVKRCDPKIRAGMEILVVDERGILLAEGQALLSAKEMLDFTSGVAVQTRSAASKL